MIRRTLFHALLAFAALVPVPAALAQELPP